MVFKEKSIRRLRREFERELESARSEVSELRQLSRELAGNNRALQENMRSIKGDFEVAQEGRRRAIHERDTLAAAILTCAQDIGIVRSDVANATGPELLLFLEDIRRHIKLLSEARDVSQGEHTQP